MRYAVVIEKVGDNFSAYVPDLPGCVATGDTREEAEREIRMAVRFHLKGLKEDGLAAPKPQATLTYVARHSSATPGPAPPRPSHMKLE